MNADPAEFSKLADIFQHLVNGAFALAGLACFAFILVGAFRYLNSGGDDKAIQAAKNTITFAIVGLVVVVGGAAFMSTLIGDTTWGITGILKYPGGIRFDIPHP